MCILLTIAALSYSGATMAVVLLLFRIWSPEPESLVKRPLAAKSSWLRDLWARHAALVRDGRQMVVDSPVDCAAFAKRLHYCEIRFTSRWIYVRAFQIVHS
jgi:hypothetical protein